MVGGMDDELFEELVSVNLFVIPNPLWRWESAVR